MIKKIASRKLLCNRELNLLLCDNLEGLNAESGKEVKGGDICILMADSRCAYLWLIHAVVRQKPAQH